MERKTNCVWELSAGALRSGAGKEAPHCGSASLRPRPSDSYPKPIRRNKFLSLTCKSCSLENSWSRNCGSFTRFQRLGVVSSREKRARKEKKVAKKDDHKKGKGKSDEPKRSKKAIRRAEKKAIKKAKAEAKQESLQYVGNKAWRRSASAAAPPPPSPPEIFGGKKKDFEAWRLNMERKFKSKGVWEVVKPGYVEPKQKELDKLPQYELDRLMRLDSAAGFLLAFSVEGPLRERYLQASSAKKAWQKLIDRCQTEID